MKKLVLVAIGLLPLTFSCKTQQAVSTPVTVEPALTTSHLGHSEVLQMPDALSNQPAGQSHDTLKPAGEEYGTIKGKVIYEGGGVKKALKVIKDEHTCGTGDVQDESLVANAEGGLQWAVVSISSDIKNGKGLDQLPGDRTLNQTTCVYSPHVVLVGVGQELTINNMDHTLHNVRTTSFMNDVVNKVQIYMPNMPHPSDKVTFKEPEVITVLCDVHGWMKAYVHVVEHPYNAITVEDGSFELTQVPPGKYTLKTWHEKLGELEQEVEVKAGQASEVQFSYKKLE